VDEAAAAVEFPTSVDGNEGSVSSDVDELAAAVELPTTVDGGEGRAMVVATGVLTSTELELGVEETAEEPLPSV
jgi:hypothetical protein